MLLWWFYNGFTLLNIFRNWFGNIIWHQHVPTQSTKWRYCTPLLLSQVPRWTSDFWDSHSPLFTQQFRQCWSTAWLVSDDGCSTERCKFTVSTVMKLQLMNWHLEPKCIKADLIPLQKGGTVSPWSGVKRGVEHCRTMFYMYTSWSMCICIR